MFEELLMTITNEKKVLCRVFDGAMKLKTENWREEQRTYQTELEKRRNTMFGL